MSPTIITPANFAQNLAMYMDAAAIGRVVSALEDGRIVFEANGSEPAELERIVEFNPRAERINVAASVERGNSSGIRGDISKLLGEVKYVQSIADATVRRKDRRGNFRKEAGESYELASKFFTLPDERLVTSDAADAFLKSAFLYTSFTRSEDRTRAFDLFMSAAKCYKLMKRHTASAVVHELAWEILKGRPEEALTVLKLRRMAAEAWLESVEEYVEPDSMRFRIFRGLVHSCFMPSRRIIQEFLRALSGHDFEDDKFYEGYSNHIRRAHAISNHGEVKKYEWRTVGELLKGTALTWNRLEGVEIDIAWELMMLARAAETFAAGRDQHLAKSEGR